MAISWRESYVRYREFFLNISDIYKQKADLRAFLEVILSLTTITVFLLFALKPTALTIINLLQQIQEKRQTLSALNQKLADLQTASTLLDQNQNFIPDINTAVPTAPNPDVLSKQIEGLSVKDSVEILGISVNAVPLFGSAPTGAVSNLPPLPNGANGMSFSLSVKGAYTNLVSFIKDFENLRVITKADNLGVSSSLTDQGRVIDTVISGRVPFLSNE